MSFERRPPPDVPDLVAIHLDEPVTFPPEALVLFERTASECERTLGPDHPRTMLSRENLVWVLRARGQTADAVALLEQLVHARERLLGVEHPETLVARCELASSYWDLGRTADALSTATQALTVMERILGPEHPACLQARELSTSLLRELGG